MRISDILIRRFPKNARYPAYSAEQRACYATVLMRIGNTNESLIQIARSRAEIDALASADPDNDLLRLFRSHVAVLQSEIFALWSRERSAGLEERHQRLSTAQAYMDEAEVIFQTVKAQGFALMLQEPRELIAAAQEELLTASQRDKPPD